MIFVTVGEQLPFDRLIRAMDRWASENTHRVFAQIGRSVFRPNHIGYKDFLELNEFQEKFLAAHIIVAHAGMGTIISALEMGKRIIVMPRRAAYGEHRNDHQISTARKFKTLNYVEVAYDDAELWSKLKKYEKTISNSVRTQNIEPSSSLINTIKNFIRG